MRDFRFSSTAILLPFSTLSYSPFNPWTDPMNTVPTPETSFRAATAQDIDALRQCEQGIVSAERAFDPTLKAGRVQYYDIEKMILDEQVRFVVAERGNELIGCGFARIDTAKAFLSHSQQAYLGLMYVDPRYRGQSINGQIVERLKQWCRTKGVSELRLDVYSDNLIALGAYEKAGFSKHMIEMRLRLDDT
jgi:RimJ/RimL family protein N-acetyltransferase